MKWNKIKITETISNARHLLATDQQISPALKAMFEMMLVIITLLAGRLGLNSDNKRCCYLVKRFVHPWTKRTRIRSVYVCRGRPRHQRYAPLRLLHIDSQMA